MSTLATYEESWGRDMTPPMDVVSPDDTGIRAKTTLTRASTNKSNEVRMVMGNAARRQPAS